MRKEVQTGFSEGSMGRNLLLGKPMASLNHLFGAAERLFLTGHQAPPGPLLPPPT